MVYKLPENMGTMDGALVEPLAIGFNIARQAGARIGDSAHICGAGCIGLVTVMALKAMGITDISISDVIDSRLEFACGIGAKEGINAEREDVLERINQATNNTGVDIVIEVSGNMQ